MSYSEKVLDHYENPRNVGSFDKSDQNVGTGMVGAPACGDVMRLYIKVQDDKIAEAKFKTFGCGAAIATSSMATEMIKDKTIEEASKVTNEAVAEALDGLPPNKMHCSVLAQEAIEAAIKNYNEKKQQAVVVESCSLR